MHILFLTDNYPPEVNAPASRTHDHCRAWVAAGHKVTVITCFPNFPQGRVFDGYTNKLWQRGVVDGVNVVRVWTYITANEGFARRTFDYLSFMFSSFFATFFVRGADVVIGTSPQFFTACSAWLASVTKRRPFVFELRDLWPESIKAVGAMKDSLAIRLLERVELFLYRRAASIVSVTHSFKRVLIGRNVDGAKIDVVTNGADLSRFAPMPKDIELEEKLGLTGRFVVGYVGTHGMAHALETLLLAAANLQERKANVSMLFIGDGARKQTLKDEASRLGLVNVIFVDTVPKEQVARYWSLLDAAIIHLRRTELFSTVIPSKLFEAMAMGIPLLHGVAGESAEIVARERAGIVFEPEDASALSDGVLALMADVTARMQYKGNCLAAARKYDRAVLADEMLASLERVRSGGQPSKQGLDTTAG